jgi:putative ABC transport system permease protein
MIFNYLKIAVRNLQKNTVYAIINVAGLTVGLSAFILIALWVQEELSYDRFHEKADRVYRVVENQYYSNSEVFPVAVTPAPLSADLKTNFPEVENTFRVQQARFLFDHGGKKIAEPGLMADPAIVDILSFPLVKGDAKTALSDFSSIVLAEKLAKKYFPGEEPLGKTLHINNDDFKVTAVIADVPENSHLQFDFLVSFELIKKFGWNQLDDWDSNSYQTYVLLREHASPEDVNTKIRYEIKKNVKDSRTELYLQPLTRIHLHSKFTADIGGHGDIQYVYIFSAVALFILVIACINFMNLSTARSVKRAREVGMRKVIGAYRMQLVGQFLAESILLSFIALTLAVVACQLLLPVFNEIAGKQLALSLRSSQIWMFLIAISLVTGLIAGSYPALYLSSFKPVNVLKGTFKTGKGAVSFRQALVVIQFTLSIVLITGTILIYDQLSFIQDKRLGFEKENVISFWGILSRYQSFKNELLTHPEIASITTTSGDLTYVGNSSNRHDWEGKDPDHQVLIHQLSIDYDFIKSFKIDLAAGRDFSRDIASDSGAYILNEEAIRQMGLENPVGKRFNKGTIIGVVKDFHFKSVRDKIEPLVMFIWLDQYAKVYIRLAPDKVQQGLAVVEKAYAKFNPDKPFEYSFLDEDFDEQYRSEQRTGIIFNYFAFIAIFISCLGLFGLVMFATEQRTKEIGIRKVLGASLQNVILLISTDFIKLVLIANVIAIPLAWYSMNQWLDSFAYHVDLRWTTFLIASVSSILIAWLTMSYQSLKAASANPVESLRSE